MSSARTERLDRASAAAAEAHTNDEEPRLTPRVLRRLPCSQREHGMLVAIWVAKNATGHSPTYGQLLEMLNSSSTSEIHRILDRLEKGGAIAPRPHNKTRSIVLNRRLAFVTTDDGVAVYEWIGEIE